MIDFWEAFPDIQDSYALAMRSAGVPEGVITEVTATVTDYAANNWGEE